MAPMYRLSFRRSDAELDDSNRQTSGLFGIVVVLALVVAGLFLVKRLHVASVLETCLITGRTNCEMIVSVYH